MAITKLEKLKGSFSIKFNGEYVVIDGTKLHIFLPDGELITCRKDLRYAGRSTFLSGNRMLLCSNKQMFHMIDLTSGNDIWTAPYVKTNFNLAELAISPDESYAYTYDENYDRRFISRLDLNTHQVETHTFSYDLGATHHIICDEKGVPHLLKTLNETIGGIAYSQSGVRIHDFFDIAPGNTSCWKTKWQFQGDRHAFCFWDSTDRILLEDLCIYEHATGATVDLLENETAWKRSDREPSDCWLDRSKQYLCLMYQTVNVVIDIHARRVAAQYACDPACQGCLIGNEYWVCFEGKLCRKPFPAFEEAPPIKKPDDFMADFYAKHPELW